MLEEEIDIEQVCAFKWDLKRVSKPFGLRMDMGPEYSKELAFHLGLLLPSDGFAAVTLIPDPVLPSKEKCAFLMLISAEVDHSSSRRSVPPSVVAEIRDECLASEDPDVVAAATENPEGIRLVEHFTAVMGSFKEVSVPDYVLLVNGSKSLGAKVMEWVQRRFDCYVDDDVALDPQSLKSLAVRWSLLAFNSGLPGTLRVLLTPSAAVTGISEMWMEFRLDAVKRAWNMLVERHRSSASSAALLRMLAFDAAGVNADKFVFEGFSTPAATLTANGQVEILSPPHALLILKDLSTVA